MRTQGVDVKKGPFVGPFRWGAPSMGYFTPLPPTDYPWMGGTKGYMDTH